MGSFSPEVPVIPALAAGISLHFSATVYVQLGEIAATSAAMTDF